MRILRRSLLMLWLAALLVSLAHLYSRWPALSELLAQGGDSPEAVLTPAPAPELPRDISWAQGGPLRLADLHGRVVVLHFWTNGCINCMRNYPTYRAWHKQYPESKVAIVGVHTPEFAWEAPADQVRRKARENGLTFPIALDSNSQVWKSWNNRYWPAIYLIDRKGQVRYRWDGELHLDDPAGQRFAHHIDELLAEKG